METTKRNQMISMMTVGLKLLLICALVAGVVSFVYTLTYDQYERNKQATRNEAIGRVFGLEAPVCEELSAEKNATVWRVDSNGETVGYCVDVITAGFGGDLELMVGYTAEGSILGVQVIAHSETPGLGERVKEDSFLSQFEGLTGNLTLGEDVDALSGATISSRAVTDGVNLATAALESALQTKGGAAE